MKYLKLFEQFSAEEAYEINEALKSSKLRSISKAIYSDRNLLKKIYGTYALALDKITDDEVITMDPKTAYKDRNMGNSLVFYVTTTAKENPYSEYTSTIPANSLLAITTGDNLFLGYSRGSWASAGRVKSDKSGSDSFGIQKDYKGYHATGLYSVKRISELADVAYVIPLDNVARTSDVKSERGKQREGAIALIDPRKFQEENLKRYREILATKIGGKDELSKIVLSAIDTITSQIKGAVTSGEVDRYGRSKVGVNKKGRDATTQDAAQHMKRIMDAYADYISALKDSEEYKDSYYASRAKEKMSEVRDLVNQTSNFSYAW
jgi:hypothetical protein